MSMLQPGKLNLTPNEAAAGFTAHRTVAPAAVVRERLAIPDAATAFPPASCTATVGVVAKVVPDVAVPGEAEKIRRAAGPVATVKGALVAAVRLPDTARSV